MGSPNEFHPDAHPQARDITGDLQYGEWGQCIGQSKQKDRRCHSHARGAHGKCNIHGGADGSGGQEGNDGGAPPDNTNAIKHAQFAENDRFYRKVMSNLDRRRCDSLYRDTVESYRDNNGLGEDDDVPLLVLDRIWTIAVERIQIRFGDDWLADRPRDLNSSNPMVDKETRHSEHGQYHKYSEAVTVSTKLKLQKEHRQWLKQNNMVNDPDSQLAESVGDFSSIILERETGEGPT